MKWNVEETYTWLRKQNAVYEDYLVSGSISGHSQALSHNHILETAMARAFKQDHMSMTLAKIYDKEKDGLHYRIHYRIHYVELLKTLPPFLAHPS